jgi:hypothetical protein
MPNKRNFQVTIEQPREIQLKDEREITVDRFITFVYGVPNQAEVRKVLTLPEKLKQLRKQGLRITKSQMASASLIIERI